MVKLAIYSILSLLLAYVFLLPIVRNLSMDKYEWLPTESAHPEYPMTIVSGNLYLKDGSSVYIPSKAVVDNGWGEIGSTHIVGSTMKALPVSMKITWFSFAEDKFFTGTFDLPYDHISKLFAEGRESHRTRERITYEDIIVGMAPGGEVSVWLQAEREVLLVASFTAKEDVVDWSQITENETYSRSRYIKEVLKDHLSKDQFELLEKEGIPFEKLNLYRKQYMWNVEPIGQKWVDAWIKTYNGERELFGASGRKQSRRNRAQPKELEIVWEGRDGNAYSCDVKLNCEEIFKGYAKLSAGNVNHPMHLRVEISDNNLIAVSLRDDKYILPLKKVSVKVYNARKYW